MAIRSRFPIGNEASLSYVTLHPNVTYVEKMQIYLPAEELAALRAAATRSGRSIADLAREAIRKHVLKPATGGQITLWDGEPKRTASDHDSVYEELHRLSAVDATSFVVMKRARIHFAFAFDHHFAAVGFRMVG